MGNETWDILASQPTKYTFLQKLELCPEDGADGHLNCVSTGTLNTAHSVVVFHCVLADLPLGTVILC